MLWVFAILGLVSLMSALYGLSTTWSRGGRMLAMHLFALILLGIAWGAEHTTVIGWVALGAGSAVELVDLWLSLFSRRVRGGAMPPVSVQTTVASAGASRVRSTEPRAEEVKARAAVSMKQNVAPIAPELEAVSDAADSAGADEDEDDAAVAVAKAVPEPALPLQEAAPDGSPIGEVSGDEEGPAQGSEESKPAQTEAVELVTGVVDEWQSVGEPALPEKDTPTDMTTVAPSEAPVAPSPRLLSISTFVLLKTKCDVTPGVFFASLRRGGQRDALLVEAPDAVGETWVQAGRILLKMRTVAGPCDPQALEDALVATADWQGSPFVTARHETHVVVMSEYPEETPRDEVIRLLHRTHAALAEFAPVLAVLWPEAGRLARSGDLANLSVRAADMESPMAETCVQFRVFPLSEPNDGMFLSDCVGLHALGLPDLQFITVGEPGEAVVETLHGLAERFLTAGCDLADGSDFDMGDGAAWRVTHSQGAFPPDREVIQITVKR